MERVGEQRWKLTERRRGAESSSVRGGAARSARIETDGFRRPLTFPVSSAAPTRFNGSKNDLNKLQRNSTKAARRVLDGDSGMSSRNQKTTCQTRKDEAKPAKQSPYRRRWVQLPSGFHRSSAA